MQDALNVRKECPNQTRRLVRRGRAAARAVVVCAWAAIVPMSVAGEVRLWPRAVVVQTPVRLRDVCALSGFERQVQRRLGERVVAEAPEAGGELRISLADIRTSASSVRVNLATTYFKGASTCVVSRPALALPARKGTGRTIPASASQTDPRSPRWSSHPNSAEAGNAITLRGHIERWFTRELARFGGRVEIRFGGGGAEGLELTSPPYQFRVHPPPRVGLGVVSLKVDVIDTDGDARTLPVLCDVSYFAPVVVARRPINRDMTIRGSDLRVMEMKRSALDRTFATDPGAVIGRRSTGVIPVGGVIDVRNLESVPVVTRNQLVRLVSRVGRVRIETAAKSLGTGTMHDVVTVRSLDDRRREYEAVITGPGEVTLTRAPALASRSEN